MPIITSADEHGLKGLSLDSRVRQLFYGLPPEQIVPWRSRCPPRPANTS